MKQVNANEFRAEVLESDVPVLVDFFTPTCPPCRMMMPILEGIEASLGGTAKIVKVNAATEDSLSVRYGVSAVPTFILFRDGEVVSRHIGLQPEGKIRGLLT